MKQNIILIAPFAKKLRNGKNNAKNYPYWTELLYLFYLLKKDYKLVQIGIEGEQALVPDMRIGLSLEAIKQLVIECTFWISVDSFLPHLANLVNKPGVVIWGVSDPNIFGYPTNLNILKSRDNLRKKQFDIWEGQEYDKSVFYSAAEIYSAINDYFKLIP